MNFNIPCRSNPMPYYIGTIDYSALPLTIECVQNGSFSFNRQNSFSTSNTYYYKKNNATQWTQFNVGTTFSCTTGDTFAFSGTANTLSQSDSNRFYFKSDSGKYNIYGNILSICNGDDTARNYKFCGLFGWDSSFYRIDAVDASNLILPTSPQQFCTYRRIFRSCSSLTGAPVWREINPSYSNSHNEFFWGTAIQKLKIDATSIGYTGYAYDSTVYCNSLSAVEVAITNWNNYFASNFFSYGTSTGIFIKPESLPIQRGTSYIRDGWTVLNRIGKNLYYAEATGSHQAGDLYTNEDPFLDN